MLKRLVRGLIVLAFTGVSYAGPIVSEIKIILPVDVSTATLKFVNRGYFVNLIVPELASSSLLNFRDEGEDGPSLFTYGTSNIQDVVKGKPEIVDTEFTIRQSRLSWMEDNVCKVSLVEHIEADIRGFNFMKTLSYKLPDRNEDDCL